MARPRLYVVAVDPGGTTGLAVVSVPRDTIFGPAPYAGIEKHTYMHLTGSEDIQAQQVYDHWLTYTDLRGRTPLVIEDFSLRIKSRSRDLLAPVRVGERIKQLAGPFDAAAPQWFMQMPVEAKRSVTDRRLKAWGIDAPLINGGDHARDALRHAIHFLKRAKQRSDLREAAWG